MSLKNYETEQLKNKDVDGLLAYCREELINITVSMQPTLLL